MVEVLRSSFRDWERGVEGWVRDALANDVGDRVEDNSMNSCVRLWYDGR